MSSDAPAGALAVAFFTDTYRPAVNGIVTAIDLFAGELRRQGHRVEIVGPRSPETAGDGSFHGVRSLPMPIAPDFRIGLPGLLSSARRLPDFGADVVHGHSPGPVGILGLSYAKAHAIPVVQTYHAMLTDYARVYLPRALVGSRRLVNWWQQYLYNRGDVITAPTPAIKEYLEGIGLQRPVVVLPTGIDIAAFRAHDVRLLDRFRIPPGRPVVATLSRLAPEKNVGFVIESIGLVRESRPDVLLLVIGGGPYRKKLEETVTALALRDNVLFAGMATRPEVAALLGISSIFAYACQTDTQGLVVMEAMAAGLPLLLIDNRVFEPFVTAGNGLLLPADPLAFAKQIEGLLGDADRRREWSLRSLELSLEFSIESQAGALADLYRRLLASQALPPRID